MKTGALAATAFLALALADSAKGVTQGDAPADQLVPYATVRQALIKTGYHPLTLKHGADDYFCSGDDLCRTYPEVLSCVVAGAPACRMVFFSSVERKYLLVLTNSDRISAMMTLAKMDASTSISRISSSASNVRCCQGNT
jgi:hypothetical protein